MNDLVDAVKGAIVRASIVFCDILHKELVLLFRVKLVDVPYVIRRCYI